MQDSIQFDFVGTEDKNVLLCLNTLCNTIEGTVALDRDFGLNIDFIDMPPKVAENMLALELIEKAKRYEPRVKIDSVSLRIDDDSKYKAKVVIKNE